MKVLAQRLWLEPAAATGLLTTLVLAVVALVSSADWNAGTILGVLAPTASALGIRQLVTPTVKAKKAR